MELAVAAYEQLTRLAGRAVRVVSILLHSIVFDAQSSDPDLIDPTKKKKKKKKDPRGMLFYLVSLTFIICT